MFIAAIESTSSLQFSDNMLLYYGAYVTYPVARAHDEFFYVIIYVAPPMICNVYGWYAEFCILRILVRSELDWLCYINMCRMTKLVTYL